MTASRIDGRRSFGFEISGGGERSGGGGGGELGEECDCQEPSVVVIIIIGRRPSNAGYIGRRIALPLH